MKIVADENITLLAVTRLRAAGHEIRFILEEARGMSDAEIVPFAARQQALLLTWDKGFRQLTIEAKRPSSGVLLLRLGKTPPEDQAALLLQTLQDHGEQLHTFFTTLYPDRLDMEPLP
jgi:predicted nuclease of predicted toxin-antitoxin system